jgi:hypothetical protein
VLWEDIRATIARGMAGRLAAVLPGIRRVRCAAIRSQSPRPCTERSSPVWRLTYRSGHAARPRSPTPAERESGRFTGREHQSVFGANGALYHRAQRQAARKRLPCRQSRRPESGGDPGFSNSPSAPTAVWCAEGDLQFVSGVRGSPHNRIFEHTLCSKKGARGLHLIELFELHLREEMYRWVPRATIRELDPSEMGPGRNNDPRGRNSCE